ncbi:unnamed protein product, partial [Durusdinium trenchii]
VDAAPEAGPDDRRELLVGRAGQRHQQEAVAEAHLLVGGGVLRRGDPRVCGAGGFVPGWSGLASCIADRLPGGCGAVVRLPWRRVQLRRDCQADQLTNLLSDVISGNCGAHSAADSHQEPDFPSNAEANTGPDRRAITLSHRRTISLADNKRSYPVAH